MQNLQANKSQDSRARNVWGGEPNLVIGIDIGATTTGVSYAHLTRGTLVNVEHVSPWPGQDQKPSKVIPTLIWYDSINNPRLFGAESPSRREGWTRVELFKVHLNEMALSPKYKSKRTSDLRLPVDIETVYRHYIRFLLQHTLQRFERIHGVDVWNQYSRSMILVFGHPNGWNNKQVAVLRAAAIAAKTEVTGENEHDIRFITEAEASMRSCMSRDTLRSMMEFNGTKFIVCDAGGSTVDAAIYESQRKGRSSLKFQEKKRTSCWPVGATAIDDALKAYLKETLSGAEPAIDNTAEEEGIKDFLAFEKPIFGKPRKSSIKIRVGNAQCRNDDLGIAGGLMTLNNSLVEGFFNNSVEAVLKSIQEQNYNQDTKHILLVGGFSASPYLQAKLREADFGSKIAWDKCNDAEDKPKDVADGAVRWFIDMDPDTPGIKYQTVTYSPSFFARLKGLVSTKKP